MNIKKFGTAIIEVDNVKQDDFHTKMFFLFLILSEVISVGNTVACNDFYTI